MSTRYWLGVVYKAHIERGIAGGFVQLNHGKKRPLQRMSAGDWLVIYSPRVEFEDKKSLQVFTAVGRIRSGEIYQHDMGDGFVPYRLDVDYVKCEEAEIRPLLDHLSFIPNKQHWGYAFRFGHLEILKEDFTLIAQAMGVDVAKFADITTTLYRPTGPEELKLVQENGYKRWPPRLPGQPIFYPVTNEKYASEIALKWNVPAWGVGYVTKFQVKKSFMDKYEVHQVGAVHHTEWWVPAEELEALNDNIVGTIEVVAEYKG